MITQNKRFLGIVLGIVLLLCIPLIAMQFSEEVDWSIFDFLVAGVLLFGTALVAELVLRKVKNRNSRIGLIAIILVALFIIWAELAVGIFGTPFAGS